jgi:hypothetical protein
VKKQNNSKPLFLNTKSQIQSEQTQEKKKRGRPRKNPIPEKQNTTIEKKSISTDPKKSEIKKEQLPKQSNVKPESGWKDFLKQRPESLIPLEFYVDTGKEKHDIFRGYISHDGLATTDDPYKLVVLRKRFGNLFYRFIYGCTNLDNCPNNFPSCDRCKRKKK